MNTTVSNIRSRLMNFWFGDPISTTDPDGEMKPFWFHSTPEYDQQLRIAFEEAYVQARKGVLDTIADTPEGVLVLILLLDQLPRNIFRGTRQAFESDSLANRWAKHAIALGYDQSLSKWKKMFMYMPLEHSESIEDQNQSVKLFQILGEAQLLKHALEHQDMIIRFGRFPTRNHILQRKSTPEEIVFLQEKAS